MDVSINGPKILFTLPILGGLDITETIVNSWIVIILVFIICKLLTHKLEKIPRKRSQQIAEKLVTMIDKLVATTMGERNKKFAPYILTLFTFSSLGSLISLLGFRSVTGDINVTLTWGLMTFLLIWANGLKTHGLGYFKGLFEPVFVMFPLNVISNTAIPVSLAFRHFGNITAGMIISTLLHGALAAASYALLRLPIPFLEIGIPGVLSVYFDVFSGFMQAFIFCMLTMVNVANANEPDEA
ncbi:F0F1 ATP synthase subunit A [Paludicola sp. MB14-C6]|uniref:F0F1 ATP synthase subunit A n=1 Tax=Paludihabitans sp. MB14-C6 TaxID=3070656 RepID=UPI0027DCEDA8|nr:F0F1 ATP synthase subunit A [Paludicola sp. MB14-C6]WMJ21827.1 F0F1 ATP synthase subunit A [Paludicola sp. MB14-C6]